MRAQVGVGAAVLIAIAAIVGVNSQQSGKSDREPGDPAKTTVPGPKASPASRGFDAGPCVDLEGKIQAFFAVSPPATVAPKSCDPGGTSAIYRGDSKKLLKDADSLQFVIALVPDPLHTHFSLSFDRMMEAIQQGAQDEQYFYDSSWLPWETEEQSFALLKDADSAEDLKEAREKQPGVLLFRRGSTADQDPYKGGLVVFVVGEEPTSGVHKAQFANAADWIETLQPSSTQASAKHPVKILGPTFSGSLPSLNQILADQSTQIPHTVSIYSGGITDKALVEQFAKKQPNFRSFQESDDITLQRFRLYLRSVGVKLSKLAIISEDETAFGGSISLSNNQKDAMSLCGSDPNEPKSSPACLYYPRDISALRDAYQRQAIFAGGSNGQTAVSTYRTLNPDLADPEGKAHDTIRSYSGQQVALSQEAVLQQIVSFLRSHDSEYVVLRSSNPLDQLFLSHYLRIAYPAGRIVIQGADLLLRRESGAATLSGIMTLTTYPLLQWENHWTKNETWAAEPYYSHAHRVFSGDIIEGTYIASRFLFSLQSTDKHCVESEKSSGDHSKYFAPAFFRPTACSPIPILDYTLPFWSKLDDVRDPNRPVTWLSVLGHGGFWPVAALDSTGGRVAPPPSKARARLRALSVRLGLAMLCIEKMVVRVILFNPDSAADYPRYYWPDMPISMRTCMFVVLLWVLFHLYCCIRPSLTLKPNYRAHFVRSIKQSQHTALVVFGSGIVTLSAILLAWGYGAMSLIGEPVAHAWQYRAFLPLVWILSGGAVCANTWIGSPDYPLLRGVVWMRLRTIWSLNGQPLTFKLASSLIAVRTRVTRVRKVSLPPLLYYLGMTFILILLVAFSLEAGLTPANRFPTYWRSMTLTNGVSPLAPLVAVATGLYIWCWYSLQGLAFLGNDRPLLPTQDDLMNEDFTPKNPGFLSMFSNDRVENPIEDLSDPLAPYFLLSVVVLLVVLSCCLVTIAGGVPLRTLGARAGSILFCFELGICVSLMLASALQLLRVWLRLRQLLMFLDRTPLRRTMAALKGYSWGRVWRMGGNVLDTRYRLLSRQLENVTHLTNAWNVIHQPEREWHKKVSAVLRARMAFVKWYSLHWSDWRVRDLTELLELQKAVAKLVGYLLANTLFEAWRHEDESLILAPPVVEDEDDKKKESTGVKLSKDPLVRNAEELVCLTYLGFIQNILGRMRTLVMAIAWLFVAVTISLASYPFDPRPLATAAMLILFAVLGSAIVIVYAQMHRDTTLSLVTDTKPGELGVDFWMKLIAFGAAPVLGLLATAFPEFAGTLFSWVQPGLNSIK